MWAEVFNELSRLLSYLRSGLFTGVGNSVSIVWTLWGWNDWSAGAIAFEKHFILIAKTMKIYSDHDISETMDMEVYTIKNELSTWRPEPDSDVILWSFYDTIVLEMIENILHCIVQWSCFFFFLQGLPGTNADDITHNSTLSISIFIPSHEVLIPALGEIQANGSRRHPGGWLHDMQLGKSILTTDF